MLREEFVKEKKESKIKELNDILSTFQAEKLENIPAADMVVIAKEALNKF
jgi:hypothetical protein